jgi:hypothetical protein
MLAKDLGVKVEDLLVAIVDDGGGSKNADADLSE